MLKRTKECDAADDMTRYAIVHGLRPELRVYVLQQGPTSTAALLEAAKIAEATIVAAPTVSDEILEAIRRLTALLLAETFNALRDWTMHSLFFCLLLIIVLHVFA